MEVTWFYGESTNRGKSFEFFPVGNYMVKINNRNTTTRCEICSKLTMKTPERRWCLYC